MAAKLLGVEPSAGSRRRGRPLGRAGQVNRNFGLVIGVARKGNADELRLHGAHLVVNDLSELLS